MWFAQTASLPDMHDKHCGSKYRSLLYFQIISIMVLLSHHCSRLIWHQYAVAVFMVCIDCVSGIVW